MNRVTTEPRMLVDSTKDVIIIGHPRSGSFWLQSCMPHFNCNETFNVVQIDVVGNDGKRFLVSGKTPMRIDEDERERRILSRIKLLDEVTVPKCVKILSYQITNTVIDWINNQDATVIWLERKDKLTAFKSLLISNTLNKFVGKITTSSVKVDVEQLRWLHYILLNHERDARIKAGINKSIEFAFYEDLIVTMADQPTNMEKQNTTSVTIENWDEVVEYMRVNELML